VKLDEPLPALADVPTEVVEQIKRALGEVQEEDERAIPVAIEDQSGDRFGARADGWRVVRIVVQVEPAQP
jgi:tRNA(Met) C34 N-acetyltransferase TmcA